jgi:hypothetical protein
MIFAKDNTQSLEKFLIRTEGFDECEWVPCHISKYHDIKYFQLCLGCDGALELF